MRWQVEAHGARINPPCDHTAQFNGLDAALNFTKAMDVEDWRDAGHDLEVYRRMCHSYRLVPIFEETS